MGFAESENRMQTVKHKFPPVRMAPVPPKLRILRPAIDLSILKGPKPLDVRALEMLKEKFGEAIHTPEGRRLLRFIEPRAQKQAAKRSHKVAKAIDHFKQGIPKKPRAQDRKKQLHAECEALCKAFVRKRDLNEDGYGNCCTCGTWSCTLQWGHFISRKNSPFLKYDPRNTAMQSARCNGPGQGEYAKFRDWINARNPGMAEKLEAEAKAHEKFRWTVKSLEQMKAFLAKKCEGAGLNPEEILKNAK